MEAVRKAIGVDRMAVMGTSYGTYVAEKYARAYPNRVSRLILDSVVPQENIDPFLRVHMRRAAKVLRWECGQGRCGFKTDPAADLAKLVRAPARGRVNGPTLLDWMTTVFSFTPKEIPAFGKAIHHAARGDYRGLNKMANKAIKLAEPTPADSLSWGLHAATLCTDANFPFSIGSGNRASRSAASSRYLAKSPNRAFWPFTRATAIGNGISQVCFDWQRTKVAPPAKPGKITQPTLFLTGQYDLSTPAEYAKRELRRAPRGKLVVIPKLGHASAFAQECSVSALAGFLRGRLTGDPCRRSSSRSVRTGSLPFAASAFGDSFLARP
jgi:pimeloyl-ACP methyl ester carboxylesterase